jgi:hypothetical protein
VEGGIGGKTWQGRGNPSAPTIFSLDMLHTAWPERKRGRDKGGISKTRKSGDGKREGKGNEK